MIMKHDHIIGSEDWKKHVIKRLNGLRNYFLDERKDIKAYNVDLLTDELIEYFNIKNDEGKN